MLLSLFLTPALARTAYVGVASAGPGRGVLGHVFLVFARTPGQFLDATFYQYAIQVPEDFKIAVDGVNALSRYPFAVETGPAWALIKSYVDDNRAVTLDRLDLDDARARELEARAEAERVARRDRPRRDFTLDVNCATKAYDLVNEVAGARPIVYQRPRALLDPRHLLHRARAALAVPVLALPQLARHPLTRERVIFRPGSVVAIELGLAAIVELEPLYRACGVSADAREIMTRAYGVPALRRSNAYVDAFAQLFATCALTPALTEIYDAHLDFVRMDGRDPKFDAHAAEAYR